MKSKRVIKCHTFFTTSEVRGLQNFNMSKIFYDHLIILEEVELVIKKTVSSKEEKEELWRLVDEIIHHRVFDRILGLLPKIHHEEFLGKFHAKPHDLELISYLKEKSGKDVEVIIKTEIMALSSEILKEIKK